MDPGLRRGDGSGRHDDRMGDERMSFITELKRRKVFQVAAVYAVMAWLTIQIIDVII